MVKGRLKENAIAKVLQHQLGLGEKATMQQQHSSKSCGMPLLVVC